MDFALEKQHKKASKIVEKTAFCPNAHHMIAIMFILASFAHTISTKNGAVVI